MEYRRLGNTGLSVSSICLGCMSYGDPDATLPGESLGWRWALREDDSRPFFKKALELGINFFDTANVYSFGVSEEVTGRALRDMARRGRRGHRHEGQHSAPMRAAPNGRGLSRKGHPPRDRREPEAARHADYVDLY